MGQTLSTEPVGEDTTQQEQQEQQKQQDQDVTTTTTQDDEFEDKVCFQGPHHVFQPITHYVDTLWCVVTQSPSTMKAQAMSCPKYPRE